MAKTRKRITALSPQRDDGLWQMLDAKIGGRAGLLELAMASKDPKASILAEICLDGAFSRSGTKDLARKAGMGTDDIVELYRNKKKLEAMMELHAELPAVIKGAVEDAAPSMVPCEACRAKGIDEAGQVCWVCGGKKTTRQAGDKDKLQFVGKAAGMIDKGGPLIQNNIQVNNQGSQDSFESMMRKATVRIERKQVGDGSGSESSE
jgi:hypothetical protein